VDCQLSDWAEWGQCSKPCDHGIRKRIKNIATMATGGGASCSAQTEEEEPCMDKPCVSAAEVTEASGESKTAHAQFRDSQSALSSAQIQLAADEHKLGRQQGTALHAASLAEQANSVAVHDQKEKKAAENENDTQEKKAEKFEKTLENAPNEIPQVALEKQAAQDAAAREAEQQTAKSRQEANQRLLKDLCNASQAYKRTSRKGKVAARSNHERAAGQIKGYCVQARSDPSQNTCQSCCRAS